MTSIPDRPNYQPVVVESGRLHYLSTKGVGGLLPGQHLALTLQYLQQKMECCKKPTESG